MDILLIDNYDSFTYNIAHIVRGFPDTNLEIIKSDKLRLAEIDRFSGIIFSPGPDLPPPGSAMEKVLRHTAGSIPVLGICLGLQAIVQFYGGKLLQLNEVMHGRRMCIRISSDSSVLFKDLKSSFEAGLYHSWVADPEKLPDDLEITCLSDENRIMGIRHRDMDIEAVQFHPESIMTPDGPEMIYNWIRSLS